MLFYAPMKEITDKALQSGSAICIDDPERAEKQIEITERILDLSTKMRDTALDTVYDNMQRQVDHFSTSVDVYNGKMKETVMMALELYKSRIDTEIQVRQDVLQQRKEEHDFMLMAAKKENDADIEIAEKRLQMKMKLDERAHEKEMKALGREEKRSQLQLERQQKKNEQEHSKLEKDLELAKKKDLADHEKVLKDLEAKAKKGQIDQEVRNNIMEELKVEMARYKTEMDLAQEAMRSALHKGNKSCRIAHTAPRIDWGKPPAEPPRVIPGSVSWTLS